MGTHEISVQNAMTEALKATYPNIGVRYQRESFACAPLEAAMAGGSKTKKKKGHGVPEAVIFADAALSRPIAIVECKKDKGGIIAAQVEAQEYVRHASGAGKLYIPLAIGFDGSNLTVDFYNKQSDTFIACRRANGEKLSESFIQTGLWPTETEIAELANSSGGMLQGEEPGLPDNVCAELFKRINESMHGESVGKDDRIVVFTAFLVACRSVDFINVITSGAKKTAHILGEQTLTSIKAAMSAGAEAHVGSDLSGFVDFVKPKLVGQNKGKATNGAKAISKIVYYDIPTVCAKHGFEVPEFISRLNESLFNIIDVYDAFQTYSTANDLGQYFTPRHIVKSMVRIVEIMRNERLSTNDLVYDPACGVGGFLVAALDRVAEGAQANERARIRREFGARLMGCEKADFIAHIARVNLWMHGDGTSGIGSGSSLEREFLDDKSPMGSHGLGSATPPNHPIHAIRKDIGGQTGTDGRPTVVLMNPPFPTKKKDFQSFEFVEHALEQLGEGGFLCALVPATTVISDDKLHSSYTKVGSETVVPGFRARILKHAQLHAVISLPPDLFEPGAAVNTYIIVLSKAKGGHRVNQPVLFARCPDDGYSMVKSLKKRQGPNAAARLSGRWNTEIGVGGDLADLIFFRPPAANATSSVQWLLRHMDALPNSTVPRHFTSKCLCAADLESGADWAPERFIDDDFCEASILRSANRIYAECQAFDLVDSIRRSSGVHGKSLTIHQVSSSDVSSLLGKIQAAYPAGASIADLFEFPKLARLPAAAVDEQQDTILVSASERDNASVGYVVAPTKRHVAQAMTLSVAKNAKPMVARLQRRPYCLTGDVAALYPKNINGLQFSEVDLVILAALIERHVWRFSYGRKASEERMREIALI